MLFLKETIMQYTDVAFNEVWIKEFCRKDDEIEKESELSHDRQQPCICLDMCLKPNDTGQEALDQYFDDIFHLTPAEGNCLV